MFHATSHDRLQLWTSSEEAGHLIFFFTQGSINGNDMTAEDRIHAEVEAIEHAAQTMIREQRAHYPSTYRVVQTVLATRSLMCEYRENVHRAYEMGCITIVMKEQVEVRLPCPARLPASPLHCRSVRSVKLPVPACWFD
eukprot:SAG22_NODE_925_length_6469_cov_3.836264_2_plen_139_part_00